MPRDCIRSTSSTIFGIASTAGDDTLTAPGTILGTAGYLAPEQALGEGLSAATDVWGLGVTLVESLTGDLPHGDEATWDSRRRVCPVHRRAPGRVPSLDSVPPAYDELLRAAEELGIDLSGVRADGGDGAADEKEEQVVAEGESGTTNGAGAEEAAETETAAEAKE